MNDVKATPNKMNITQAGHLPVVGAFCRKIGLTDTVDSAVPTEMSVDVGSVVVDGIWIPFREGVLCIAWSASQGQWTQV